MKNVDYLDRLLLCYSGAFNIYMPYEINGREYPAYGYFFSSVEKYVLIREANMWTSNSHEHVLFMTVEEVTEDTVAEALSLMEDYFEPELVRKNNPYPDKDHRYSYLTVAILAQKAPEKKVKQEIRRFRYEKGYLFNFRGFSQGRLVCASMEDEMVVANYQARKLKKLYRQVFTDVHSGKKTFSRQCEEEGIEPFHQEK